MQKKSVRERIISGDIKIQSKMASVEEVKNSSKQRSSHSELARRAKIGTGQLPPTKDVN